MAAISSSSGSGFSYRVQSPSRFSTPRPPSRPISIAVAGDITESIGAAISGKSKVNASIRQVRLTCSSPRVRREGTIAMSSNANACWARLLRPISNMGSSLLTAPYDDPVWLLGGKLGRVARGKGTRRERLAGVVGGFDGHLDVVGV